MVVVGGDGRGRGRDDKGMNSGSVVAPGVEGVLFARSDGDRLDRFEGIAISWQPVECLRRGILNPVHQDRRHTGRAGIYGDADLPFGNDRARADEEQYAKQQP
jgi:hypothetical protein